MAWLGCRLKVVRTQFTDDTLLGTGIVCGITRETIKLWIYSYVDVN